ncbi:thioredoxin [Paenibacillus sambharensis]|uniref:Thioredoxin n=1 Tax=Paenibacillus sambharensis TaxID=1803190 RepID=A0A2W1LM75_9BACL|nr:thioredoxin family protein [Paenibacillus sambharensis]PZD95975.1 thioredoxin [Paenibacillus sambharensis]
MKKLWIYAGLIVVLFGAIFFLNQQNKNELYNKPSSQLNPATKDILNDPNYQNIILPDELDKKVKSGEATFVYFFASDCGHCRNTTPKLMPIAEDLGIDLPQFNLREFEDYFGKYQIDFTPTLAYFEDGKEVARLVGGLREDDAPANSGSTADQFRAFLEDPKGFEQGAE